MVHLDEIIQILMALTINYGYLGAIILSFISNLIVFIPAPYLLIVFWLSSLPEFNPTLIALASAFGAAVGKLVVYFISRSGRRLLSKNSIKNLEFAKKIMDHYGPMTIFIIAATPLPDDIVYVPLGIIRYSPLKFFLYCLAGKFLLTLVIAWAGHLSINWILKFLGGESRLGILLTIAFIVVSVYATLKIDWEKIFVKYFEKRIEGKKA